MAFNPEICLSPGCGKTIRKGKFTCSQHWDKMSKQMKGLLRKEYRADGSLTPMFLAAVETAVGSMT